MNQNTLQYKMENKNSLDKIFKNKKLTLVNFLVENSEISTREINEAIKVYQADPGQVVSLLKKSKYFFGEREMQEVIYANQEFYELRMTDLAYNPQTDSYLLIRNYHLMPLHEREKAAREYVTELFQDKLENSDKLLIGRITGQAFNRTLQNITESATGRNWQGIPDLIHLDTVKRELTNYGFKLK